MAFLEDSPVVAHKTKHTATPWPAIAHLDIRPKEILRSRENLKVMPTAVSHVAPDRMLPDAPQCGSRWANRGISINRTLPGGTKAEGATRAAATWRNV